MAQVNTVLGPVDGAALGFTLSHEHVIVSSAGVTQLYPELLDLPNQKEVAINMLNQAYAEGVRTIIDCSPIDLGRDIPLLQEVSRRSKVNIVASTGAWTQIPRVFHQTTADQLAGVFIREITKGMQGTTAKAGVIKVANDDPNLRPEEIAVLRGAARATKATNIPITTHSGHSWIVEKIGVAQVKIFEEEGLDLNRVAIGHSDSTKNVDYLLGQLRKGVWLSMDTLRGTPARPGTEGHPANPDWEEKTVIIKKLMDAGFTHRLMLGHDWSAWNWGGVGNAERHQANPDGWLFTTRKILPRLKKLGATDKDIHTLMVDNPRRFLDGSK